MVLQAVSIYPRLTKTQFKIVDTLSFYSKNLYNVGLYNERQHYHAIELAKLEMSKLRPDIISGRCVLTSSYIPYTRSKKDPFKNFCNYQLCKENENYKLLHSDVAQQTLKSVENGYKVFFALLKLKSQGKYDLPVSTPHYLDKNGRYILTYPRQHMSIKGNFITLGMSTSFKKSNECTGKELTFKVPDLIDSKQIREVTLLPVHNGKCYKLEFTYESKNIPEIELNQTKYLGIDLGVNNFATFIDNATGTATIIDGKYLKSLNQWYNKENARLQSIKDKQGIKGLTNRMHNILLKRDNQINEAMNRNVKFIIDHAINNKIGNIVCLNWKGIKNERKAKPENNQNFVQIPYNKFKLKLANKCTLYGIKYHDEDTEAYTSRTDALALDEIKDQPYGKTRRIKRGLYKSVTGHLFNADVNAAMNHIRKVAGNVPVQEIASSGRFNRPVRVRISYENPVILSKQYVLNQGPYCNPPVLTGGS
jgi:IS605 OrfB family transposase